jgi:hypothetical protein
MKPAPFRYARPATAAEAVALLASSPGEAKLLAGGQSLVPLLNMRLVRPVVLVDLNGARELERIDPTPDGGLLLGALVRHADLAAAPLVRERAPLLAEAARPVGHTAIRNRGTLGGSLAHADGLRQRRPLLPRRDRSAHRPDHAAEVRRDPRLRPGAQPPDRRGMVHGSTVHGIGAALLEEFRYDETGQLLTSTFMDYLKPTAADVPTIEADRLEHPSPVTPLGAKGGGRAARSRAPPRSPTRSRTRSRTWGSWYVRSRSRRSRSGAG